MQLTAPATGETLLALNRVSVEGASASLAGRQARVPRVTLSGGSLLARRESDGQLNWLKLLVARTNAAAPAPVATNRPRRSARSLAGNRGRTRPGGPVGHG